MKSHYHELRSADIKRLNASLCRITECYNWNEVGEQSVIEMMNLIDADNACHNIFSIDFSSLKEFHQVEHYDQICKSLHHEFNEFMPFHPVIQKLGWKGMAKKTQQMSNWADSRTLEKNPLYQEAYQYIDAKYQLSIVVGTYDEKSIVLTVNRKNRDYSLRDIQRIDAYCIVLRKSMPILDEKFRLQRFLDILYQSLFKGSKVEILFDLTPTELRILKHYISGSRAFEIAKLREIKVNTVHKHTQSICEKMGIGSIRKLNILLQKEIRTKFKEKNPVESEL